MQRKNLPKRLLIFFCIFIDCFQYGYSFVHSRTDSGKKLHWPDNTSHITFSVNSSSYTFSDTSLQSSFNLAMQDSITEWNTNWSKTISTQSTTGEPRSGRNDIYFDKSGLLSGSNVLGVTQVIFESDSGKIVEADIVLNDTTGLSQYVNEAFYIGNVLTHELGHALGMGHSEVGFSTMFYLATKGQFTLYSDDKAAVKTLYPQSSDSVITGRVIGGENEESLFGIHVLAYSLGNGEIGGSAVTESDGRFEIRGLDLSKEYTILTSPIKNKYVMPVYYIDAKDDYCLGRKSFKQAAWQGCGSSDEGHPVKIKLTEAAKSFDVGVISIRCNVDTPINYSLNRTTGFELEMDKLENTFVGHMTLNDIKFKNKDVVKLDLSSMNLPSVGVGEQLVLEVAVTGQRLYSMLKLQAKVILADYSETVYGESDQLLSDYTVKSDVFFNLNLDEGLSDSNTFEIQLAGKNFKNITYGANELSGYINEATISSNLNDFFPDHLNLGEEALFYVFNARVAKRAIDGSITSLGTLNNQFEMFDNKWCPDAPLSYKVFPNLVKTNSSSVDSEKSSSQSDDALSSALGGCGTISGPGGGPPSGPGNVNFVLSLLLGLMLSSLANRFRKAS